MKQKEIVVKPLRTLQDFTELLSLSDLKVQMGVMGFLQQNLFEYQMNYFKSQLMDWDNLIEYISDNDKPKFFKRREYISGEYDHKKGKYIKESSYAEYDWEYAKKQYTEDRNHYDTKSKKERSDANRRFFLVDHKNKELYTVNKKLVDKFTFSYDGKYLVCNYLDIRKDITHERFAQCKMHDRHHEITIWFNLEKNCVESFSDNVYYKNGSNCGSWYSTENEKFSKNFITDEEEPWLEEEKIKSKLAKNKAKSTETFYTSENYGEFVIKTQGKKFIIYWYPKDEDDNVDTEAYKLDSDELRENYFDSHDCYINDYLGFSLEDLEDLPKDGKFNSKDEAYNFIVSKFGKVK